jgi:non-specific serine/threonine protein kinase
VPDAISISSLIRHVPLQGIPHNVPPALSSFIGRAGEQAEVMRALVGSRLVTITGPGGVGKTRLAREIAADIVSAAPTIESRLGPAGNGGPIFSGGVWWVELAPINDATDVAPAVAAVLGVRPSPGRDIVAAIVESLRGADARRRVLLVLDNCEHVVEAAATLADRLLRSAPALTILATSREALAIDGEKAWVLPPLASPPLAAPSVDSIARFEAVRLFVDRASAASPAFALTERTAPSVAAIAARLDGLPLALELAAASVGALGVEQVASRLDDVFSLLTRGRRTALPRHRTLRALLDWSYQLLAPDEQLVLARLAVFRGRFSVDAAEMLGAGGPDDLVPDDSAALRALGRLVEQSLVDVREDGGETRFRLLETVKQYGLARLAENPARERAARAKHAAWVRELTEGAASATWSAARGRTVARLERDVDEIRAALDWAIGSDGDVLTAIRIGAALAWFWFSGVPWPEARLRTAAILSAADRLGADADRTPEEQASLAELLYPFSGLAFFASDTASMLAAGRRALALWDRVDVARRADAAFDATVRERAVRGRSVMHQMMGLGHALRGETDAALVAMDASIAVARAGGDRWMEAVMLARRALANAMGGRGDAALADYASAVPLLRNVGEMWFLSLALEGMAAVELARGSIATAAAHARESIAVLRAEPDPWFISRSLDTLASVAASNLRSDTELGVARAGVAARLSAAASALRSRRGAEVMESDKERRATTIAAARAALGETSFREAWELGEALDLAGVFALVESLELAPPSAEQPELRQTPIAPNTARAHALSIEAVGPLVVARDGVPLASGELPAGKATELLLYLLLHPEGRTKEQIGLALWPDASAGQIRASFHVILHHLRRALAADRDAGSQWITFADGRYRLLREVSSPTRGDGGPRLELDADVDAILSAAEVLSGAELREEAVDPRTLDGVAKALARRRGELGEGVTTGDWLLVHADRLGRVWRDGMEALARQLIRIGRNSEAELALEAVIADEPLREGAHRELMALWAAVGERARALAHYDTLVSLLRREVGALPDRETQLLAERIRRH